MKPHLNMDLGFVKGDIMLVELLEDVHVTWCPKGTVGRLESGAFYSKFYPIPSIEDSPWKDGVFIGDAKYKEVTKEYERKTTR